ncbi:MAG: sigma-70 family RNA polymerase sigma factor, partial [Bdellovibrionales bacterium]|nr:sigma-70 family RNA polymerase sigma factor [Bdellovibrionales bacterium]
DVAQEAFVKAYLSLKNFRQDSSFYTWLYRIAYNMAIDFKRKVARRGGSAVEWDPEMLTEQVSQTPLLQESERPDESFERGELRSALKFALEELTEPHRVVIVLREVDGMSYDEIADVVGVSKGTVMSRLHYARKRLQEILSESAFGKPVEISDRELHDVR